MMPVTGRCRTTIGTPPLSASGICRAITAATSRVALSVGDGGPGVPGCRAAPRQRRQGRHGAHHRSRTTGGCRGPPRGCRPDARGQGRRVPRRERADARCVRGGPTPRGGPGRRRRAARSSRVVAHCGNAAAISGSARPAGPCSLCTVASASNTGMWARRNAAAAVDLPMPIPPVRPMIFIVCGASSSAGLHRLRGFIVRAGHQPRNDAARRPPRGSRRTRRQSLAPPDAAAFLAPPLQGMRASRAAALGHGGVSRGT